MKAMRERSEEPWVALVFKAFAMLCGLIAGWHLLMHFGQVVEDDAEKALAKAARHFALMLTFSGSGLSLWWMGEVCGLLGRIAGRLEQQLNTVHAPGKAGSSKSNPDTKRSGADLYKLD